MGINGQDYILRFNLTGFIESRIVTIDGLDGNLERGVFIPIDTNGLYEDPASHHVLCEAYVNSRPYSVSGKTHSLKQKFEASHAEKMKSMGFKNPNLGNMWLNKTTFKCRDDMKSQRVKIDTY